MMMPGMDGEILGKMIREDAVISNTLLVMMSSIGEHGRCERLTEIGFAAFLTKPVKQSQLYDCLATVLATDAACEDIEDQSAQVESAPGSASRKNAKKKKTASTKTKARTIRKHKGRILVAEDNVVNQKVALKLLEKLDYHADAVANGKEAVHSLKNIPYDLVLMDIQMPEMDGIEATRIIRGPDSTVLDPGIPIIALTAHALKGDNELCVEVGMNDYLVKPIHKQKLSETIARWLSKTNKKSSGKASKTTKKSPGV
jgi:CheY-like chemotaxis protein